MSMDYHPSAPNSVAHGQIYAQAELDQFANLQNEGLGVSEHPGYDLFSNQTSGNSFSSQRYRANASSSSSFGSGYSMNADTMYSHASYTGSVPSFSGSNGNPYDIINGMPSSYSSGKAPPLTSSDAVGHLPPVPAFSSAGMTSVHKEYTRHTYTDPMPDRRLSSMGTHHYQTDYPDEYVMASGITHPNTVVPTFSGRSVHERSLRFPDPRFPSVSGGSHAALPCQSTHVSESLGAVPPQVTHSYRPENTRTAYDDYSPLLGPSHDGELPHHMPPVDESLARMKLQTHSIAGPSNDLQTFIRPYLEQYVRTDNRLAFGERSVVVMSSRVAQKSYGTEKRFLCPPPTAIMIGNSWWTEVNRRGEEPKLCPPRVVISISGEPPLPEVSVEWTGSTGKTFDVNDPPSNTTFIGRCVGKQLFISDVDEKKKKVEALVKIMAPACGDEPERVIGTFPSWPIKVISKPSKKRQSAKNLELCINHGSTISLFHRLRSQTVSTKYLCVSGSGSSFKGSDGAPLMGLDQRSRSTVPSFIARTASWDPFVMYIVDVNKPAGGVDERPPPPPQADYPVPPPNAIPFTTNGSQIPIYYNQTIVLQCLTSGVVSPVLIIRKVDHQTIVVGGGLQDGAKGVVDHHCVPGEVCGDPVSQLHKIAFEVFEASKGPPEPGAPGVTGAFLSCMGEKVNTYRPVEGRQWGNSAGSNSPALPGSPTTPGSEYFAHGTADSEPASPISTSDLLSNDGGRVRKPKRSSSSTGGITKSVGIRGRRRPNSAGSSSSTRRGSTTDVGASSGALWQVDIGEASVWTIVGTDQVRYNFYVPPVLFDQQQVPPSRSFPIPTKPITPFPSVVKYLAPDRAAEGLKHHSSSSRAMMSKHLSKLLTLYGENFSKNDSINVFFGSDPSPYVEVRCTEAIGCLPPDTPSSRHRPIILVRGDGVVFPTRILYP